MAFQNTLFRITAKSLLFKISSDHGHERDSLITPVRKALEGIVADRFDEAERIWIQAVESLRSTLCRSAEKIPVTDFGAGKSGFFRRKFPGNVAIGDLCRRSALTSPWCLLLFKLVRQLQPQIIIELGTSTGISAAYLAAACHLNGHGRVITLEGSPAISSLAEQNFRRLNLGNIEVIPGRFHDTLTHVLTVNAPGFAFVDGHHDHLATMDYFHQIRSHLKPGGWIVFDDILWSRGMRAAWRDIRGNPGLAKSLNLLRMGIWAGEANV